MLVHYLLLVGCTPVAALEHASYLQMASHSSGRATSPSPANVSRDVNTSASEARTLRRMQWWNTGHGHGAPLSATDQYVLFTGDNGGPNNARIGWEMAGVIAKLTGRTLVLPPPWRMYLMDYGPRTLLPPELEKNTSWKTAMEDLVDLKQLQASLPTLTAVEFEKRVGLSWQEAVNESTQVVNASCSIEAYEKVNATFLFFLGTLRVPFACGEWSKKGGPVQDLRAKMTDAEWSLLKYGFVYHDDIFRVASRVVHFLGIFDYNALHARYGDFQFHEGQQNATRIFDKWAPLFQSAPKLWVSSDDPEINKSINLSGVEVFTFDDMLSARTNFLLEDTRKQFDPMRWFKIRGPVEQLICTFSRVFVGSRFSSFSGHIDRMRVHAQAPVTRKLRHKEDEVNMSVINKEIQSWNSKKNTRETQIDIFLHDYAAERKVPDQFTDDGRV